MFEQSKRLENVTYAIRGPVLDEANKMEANGEKLLKLNIGNPAPFDFHPTDELVSDMKDKLSITDGYSASNGLLAAREAIVRYANKKGYPNVTVNDVYTGNGVSELIIMCMQALCNDGDEVLVPAPDYPLWTAAVNFAGGKAVHYLCDEQSDWAPDIADIRKKVSSKTKAIVIINPNNPTGAIYPKEVLEQIITVARENDLIIFADEIYDRLIMDGYEHTSISSLCPDRFVVTFNGLSKSHRVCGYRAGWMCLCGDKSQAQGYIKGLKMVTSMRLCSNVPAQAIIPACMDNLPDVDPLFLPDGRIYKQREIIYNALMDIPGITTYKPKATFYIFPKIDAKKFNIVNDEKFVMDFLREKKVLLVHGTGFNWPNPDHFRIVFLPEEHVLTQSMQKLGEFLKTYKQA